jgi:xylulokinase
VGAALGAARLGLCAAEGADPLAVCTMPEIAATVVPDKTKAAAYADGLARYRRLYPAVKAAMG